jgi:hypothetical protein
VRNKRTPIKTLEKGDFNCKELFVDEAVAPSTSGDAGHRVRVFIGRVSNGPAYSAILEISNRMLINTFRKALGSAISLLFGYYASSLLY